MSQLTVKIKLFIGRTLSNKTLGNAISSFYNHLIPFYGTKINVADPAVSGETKAALFWRIYEPAEIRFVKKYLQQDEDVIELGSSIGVMGCIVSKIQKKGMYISVEANSNLIDLNRKNVSYNRKADYVLLNKAVDYLKEEVSFSVNSNSLSGKVIENNTRGEILTVDTITLNEICDTYNLNKFTLVCDIEGAEIAILLNDENALKKCSKMIIELHNTEYEGKTYLAKDLCDLIISHNFTIVDHRGSVFVFTKNG
jgi:FkbM family methyltransferase